MFPNYFTTWPSQNFWIMPWIHTIISWPCVLRIAMMIFLYFFNNIPSSPIFLRYNYSFFSYILLYLKQISTDISLFLTLNNPLSTNPMKWSNTLWSGNGKLFGSSLFFRWVTEPYMSLCPFVCPSVHLSIVQCISGTLHHVIKSLQVTVNDIMICRYTLMNICRSLNGVWRIRGQRIGKGLGNALRNAYGK